MFIFIIVFLYIYICIYKGIYIFKPFFHIHIYTLNFLDYIWYSLEHILGMLEHTWVSLEHTRITPQTHQEATNDYTGIDLKAIPGYWPKDWQSDTLRPLWIGHTCPAK